MGPKPIAPGAAPPPAEVPAPSVRECKIKIPEYEVEGHTLSDLVHDPFFNGCDQVFVETPNGATSQVNRNLQVKSLNPRQVIFSFGGTPEALQEVVKVIDPHNEEITMTKEIPSHNLN